METSPRTWKDILKKNPTLRQFGRAFRRKVLRSKLIYFLSSSPLPISDWQGFDRGIPLDRYFIEKFLAENTQMVKGKCLEILNNTYTHQFGGDKVTTSDILDIETSNKQATIVDDLRHLKTIRDNTYDCIILTQVFQFIDDVEVAISECYRILAPRGTLLVTVPALSRADCTSGAAGDFWRFTPASAKYLFEKYFDKNNIQIAALGNARTSTYFYVGLAVEDTPKKILGINDENFPTIITVCATK